MGKGKVTTGELAAMIQRGFAETARKDDVDKQFDGGGKRLDAIEDHLESIEKLMLEDHKRRIERPGQGSPGSSRGQVEARQSW